MRSSLVCAALALFVVRAPSSPRAGLAAPALVLWAWERPEDLRFLEGTDTGVAFLASTVTLEGDAWRVDRRRQPLRVSAQTRLVAVVRVESSRQKRPSLSADQRGGVARELARVAEIEGVRGVQIDYDAPLSEREFYRALLASVREAVPREKTLSMTALASWCTGDAWIDDGELPVDEVVPMLFSMGPDAPRVWGALDASLAFPAARCRESLGVSASEPARRLPPSRRLYLWSPKPWDRATFERVRKLVGAA